MGGGPASSDDIKKMQEAEDAAAAAQAMLSQNAQVGPGGAGQKRPSDAASGLDDEERLTFQELKKKYGLDEKPDASQFLGGGSGAMSGSYGGYGGYGGQGIA